jgi:hypothetical protein
MKYLALFAFFAILIIGAVLVAGNVNPMDLLPNPPQSAAPTTVGPVLPAPTEVSSATPTPVPSATATEIPSATPTPVPSATATEIPSATPTPVPSATATEIPEPGSFEAPLSVTMLTGTITIQAIEVVGDTYQIQNNGIWYIAAYVQGVEPFEMYGNGFATGVTGQHWLKPEEMVLPFTGEVSLFGEYLTVVQPIEFTQKDTKINSWWINHQANVLKYSGWAWDTSPFGKCVSMLRTWLKLGWSDAMFLSVYQHCWGPIPTADLPTLGAALMEGASVEAWRVTTSEDLVIYIRPDYLQTHGAGGPIYQIMRVTDLYRYPDQIIAPGIGLRNDFTITSEGVFGELFIVATGESHPFHILSNQGYIRIERADGTFVSNVMIYIP